MGYLGSRVTNDKILAGHDSNLIVRVFSLDNDALDGIKVMKDLKNNTFFHWLL